MALRKDYEVEATINCATPLGVIDGGTTTLTLSNAYIRIDNVDGGKDAMGLSVSISDGERTLHKSYVFTPSVANDSENFIRQGYEYLKTLPEFAGAADC